MNDSDSSLTIFKSCYEKRGIIYPQLIDTEIDKSWERNLYMYISSQSGFLSMPYIVPCALGVDKYFQRISKVSEIVPMFPYRGPNDRTKTNLTCTRGFRWIAGSTSNDSIRRLGIPGEKSGLKYPQPLQSLLSVNQVNICKDKILSKI